MRKYILSDIRDSLSEIDDWLGLVCSVRLALEGDRYHDTVTDRLVSTLYQAEINIETVLDNLDEYIKEIADQEETK